MNPLEIYKRLPRINCGDCPAKTCMAFAIKVLKKEQAIAECPRLTEQLRKEIDSMLPVCRTGRSYAGDWKEKRLAELFQEISQVDFSSIAECIGAKVQNGLLKIKYMGKEVFLSHSVFEEAPGIWDKLLILMYIKNAGSSSLSGKWTAFRDLKNGLLRAAGFKDICEAPLARIFDENKAAFLKKLNETGAEEVTGFSAKYSFIVYPLPRIPFLILLRPREEDFEPDCKVLLDSTATEFLDVEALLYLGMALTVSVRS